MNGVSHQTVRLGKGRHASPEHGACVVELASMLAGEAFTDHPRSVCRLLGAFLRGYNDMIDDERRQDLYECAAKIVDTAGPPELEMLRAERLAGWTEGISARRRFAVLTRIGRCVRRRGGPREPEACAREAILAVRNPSEETHASVLALIDELVAIRPESMMGPTRPPAQPAPATDPVALS